MSVSAPERASAGGPSGATGGVRLGELLVRRRLLTEEQLDRALEQQRQVGAPLGTVLLASGVVTRFALYEALGDLWGVEVRAVDAADRAVAELFPSAEMAAHGWVPVSSEVAADGSIRSVTVAVAGRPEPAIAERVRTVTGAAQVDFVVTTDWDVRRAIATTCGDRLAREAASGLAVARPEVSASRVVTRGQVLVAVLLACAAVGCGVRWPTSSAVAVLVGTNAVFALSIAFKIGVSLVGACFEKRQVVTDDEVAAMLDVDLPVYTILVPAYREANVVGSLMDNLAQLDYPREKLEILLLLEADDPETLAAARAAAPPDIVKFVVVPEGGPKTKPKACNVGLTFARGEFLVIYDAEDRPEPDQLKKAVAAFAKAGPNLACVQAALNYFNPEENLLTRMFTLEYSAWFDYMLPGLDVTGLPIPLGGTSNHFRTEMLRELGGWDPYNVTEDADLGIRASALHTRVTVINSTTFEEANKAVGNWIRQRSRWIKGYLQTTLVHTRNPVRLVRAVGLKQALGFGLLIGGTPLSFLLGPPLWALFGVSLADPALLRGFLPQWLQVLNLLTLVVGNTVIVYLNMLAVFKRRQFHLIWFALLNPLYWVLHSIAAYKALWQLISGRAFYWEKTEHGLTGEAAPQPGRVGSFA